MQEIIQKEEIISFEQIVPEFSRFLSENGGFMVNQDAVFVADGEAKSMQDDASCMVSEAHGN